MKNQAINLVWQTVDMAKEQLVIAFQIGQITWKEMMEATDELQFKLLHNL